MTEAQKKALIKKLGAESNRAFNSHYSGANREWFVGKILKSLISQGVPDANIEQRINDIISASLVALNARVKKGFSEGNLANRWGLYDKLKSRTQIIYGMIAMHPEFLNAANAAYFDFILERRFRPLQRMTFYVNPNKIRNVFDYPSSATTPPEIMKVNKDAGPFWDAVGGGTLPFVLSTFGKTELLKAIENLFKKNKDTDRNLFACDPVVTILHMDALLAAKTPHSLLTALAAVGDHYLKIDHPLGHFANAFDGQRLIGITSKEVVQGADADIELGKIGPILKFIQQKLKPENLTSDKPIPFQGPDFLIVHRNFKESFKIKEVKPVSRVIRAFKLSSAYPEGARIYVTRKALQLYKTLPFHFITDNRFDHALFEQVSVVASDLQVGDHVYVSNHPLYQLFYPTGAWGGEHSFISEIGIRDSRASAFRTSLKAEGHGIPNTTLLGMGNEMLAWINTVLGILQPLTRIHLKNLKTNGRTPTNKVKVLSRKENGVNINVFEYDMPYTHKLFREAGKKETITTGFVIKERASDPSGFQIFNANGKDSTQVPIIPSADVFLGVVFTGTSSDDPFALSKWAAPYFNVQTLRFESQPLFENDNKTPKLLTFDDLAKSKPFLVTDDVGDAYVTRPRVDFSPTYQAFLKKVGAI